MNGVDAVERIRRRNANEYVEQLKHIYKYSPNSRDHNYSPLRDNPIIEKYKQIERNKSKKKGFIIKK